TAGRSRPDLVVDQKDVVTSPVVEARAGGRVPVDRVPLAIDRRVRHAGIAANERRAMVLGARGAEVSERQVVEVEVAARVDRELGVAAARARIGLARLG